MVMTASKPDLRLRNDLIIIAVLSSVVSVLAILNIFYLPNELNHPAAFLAGDAIKILNGLLGKGYLPLAFPPLVSGALAALSGLFGYSETLQMLLGLPFLFLLAFSTYFLGRRCSMAALACFRPLSCFFFPQHRHMRFPGCSIFRWSR